MIEISLDLTEANALVIQLYEDLCRCDGQKANLVINKFKNIQVVLDALFGIKTGMFSGPQKSNPYFSETHIKNLREIQEDHSNIFKIEFKDRYIDKIYNSLNTKVNFSMPSPYQTFSEIEEEKWKALTKRYQSFVNKKTSETELHRIVFELLEKHGFR